MFVEKIKMYEICFESGRYTVIISFVVYKVCNMHNSPLLVIKNTTYIFYYAYYTK